MVEVGWLRIQACCQNGMVHSLAVESMIREVFLLADERVVLEIWLGWPEGGTELQRDAKEVESLMQSAPLHPRLLDVVFAIWEGLPEGGTAL